MAGARGEYVLLVEAAAVVLNLHRQRIPAPKSKSITKFFGQHYPPGLVNLNRILHDSRYAMMDW
jgi:hypothetical protein